MNNYLDVFTELNQKVNQRVAESNESISNSEGFLSLSYDGLSDVISQNELVFSKYDSINYNMQIDAFDLISDDEISLFITNYDSSTLNSIDINKINACFEKVVNFIQYAKDGKLKKLDDSQSIAQIANFIYSYYSKIKKINIYLICNQCFKSKFNDFPSIEGKEVICEVFDLSRLVETNSFDNHIDKEVNINFKELYNDSLKFVKCDNEYVGKNYTINVYMMFIKGRYLASLYDHYGYDLLEGNVRSYLKKNAKTTSTNEGILTTIEEQPNLFVSYNNGLSTVASDITIANDEIIAIKDWKIVNGGQTTASLHDALKMAKNLDEISVPIKLTVITNCSSTQEEEILISDIARYANTQNKVNQSDLSSNEKYHIEIEKLSREVCVPQVIPGSELEKWFYERIKGKYNFEMSKAVSETAFKKEYPTKKRFDKTDLAKSVMSWEQEPYTVSLGKEKNFITFNSRLKANEGLYEVNNEYYKQIIATLILYNEVGKVVKSCKFGGYNANVQTYVVALISSITNKKLDLINIWNKQKLDDELLRIIKILSTKVFELINDTPANNTNVAMYCRKNECWDKIEEYDYDIEIPQYLCCDKIVNIANNTSITNIGSKNIDIEIISADEWGKISAWGKETELLTGPERSMAYSMCKLLRRQGKPTSKQTDFAKSILRKAYTNGFIYKKEGV